MGKTLILPPTRFILLHYHIMKNGGTTIASILEREFGHSFEEVHGSSESSCIEPYELSAYLAVHPGLKAISSHHIRYPMPEAANTVIFDCCFLRHPLDRLWSLYHFSRKPSAPPMLHKLAQTDFREYVTCLIRDHPQLVLSPQTNLIANGGRFTRPPSSADLRKATRILSGAAFPGVLQSFDQSMVAAEYFLRPAFPSLQLHYIAQNITSADTLLNERLLQIADECGAGLLRQLTAFSEHDLQLVDATGKEVQRRYHLVPEADRRQADFEARCRGLSAPAENSSSVAVGSKRAERL